jgi:hypothetical protein
MTTCVYRLEEFYDIHNKENFIDLSEEVIHSILTLSDSITINEVKKPFSKDRRYGRDRKDFEFDRKFPSTFRNNFVETAPANEISNIRNALNKISQKNYDKQKDIVEENIKKLLENKEEFEMNIKTISEILFDIASSNSFFSLLYATLYKDLLNIVPELNTELYNNINKYKNNISELKYSNPENNYNDFCSYNKQNDARKSFTLFLINMNNLNIISIDIIIDIISFIQNMIDEWKSDTSKTNEVDELVEILFLILTSDVYGLYNHNSWNETILKNVQSLSVYKKTNVDSSIGISSRATFRCMDILENVQNK